MQLYFLGVSAIELHQSYGLDDETHHHLYKVLRYQVGDCISLTNGKGVRAIAVIQTIDARTLRVYVNELELLDPPSSQLTVAVSPLQHANRWEWMIEKIVELGVMRIVPLICERTGKKHLDKKNRLRKIIQSAMLQSQSCYLPLLSDEIDFRDFLVSHKPHQGLIAHCETAIQRIPIRSMNIEDAMPTSILIGPEGDFSLKEIDQALHCHYTSVSLGNRRLRTETAAIYAVSCLV